MTKGKARPVNDGVSDDALDESSRDADVTPLPVEINEYLTHLVKERDLSPNTVSAYRRDLREFCTYLAATKGTASWDWNDLGRVEMRGFLAHSTRRGLAKRSIARALSAVRSFYRWMHRDERVDESKTMSKIRIMNHSGSSNKEKEHLDQRPSLK